MPASLSELSHSPGYLRASLPCLFHCCIIASVLLENYRSGIECNMLGLGYNLVRIHKTNHKIKAFRLIVDIHHKPNFHRETGLQQYCVKIEALICVPCSHLDRKSKINHYTPIYQDRPLSGTASISVPLVKRIWSVPQGQNMALSLSRLPGFKCKG